MKTYFLFTALVLLSFQAITQDAADRAYIIEQTNTEALEKIITDANAHYKHHLAIHKKNNGKMTITNHRNQVGYLSGFDAEGKPFYSFDDNAIAAQTGRADKIKPGGSAGLDLDGSGVVIGHWESGLARLTHVELAGRVMHAQFGIASDHATHTAGTMIASGQDPGAEGMAPNAQIEARTSDSDEPEIAAFAMAGGLLSNHSYYQNHPKTNDGEYGVYKAARWDLICYNAPYYLIVKSAGNDRDDGYNAADGGYDLLYDKAVAKNILVVGAVEDTPFYNGPSSVEQSGFNNFGPTDDWRIKPDITTNGVTLYSGSNQSDTGYDQLSGTSMSTAAVTGTIALLQQHFHELNGVYMKSATVKSLLLSTTDEVGQHPGPDFQSGWGLLNAERAAEVISNRGVSTRINELSLNNNSTYTTTIENDGNTPLTVAIAWTDFRGSSNIGTDNLSPRLVNDLDVRVFNDDDNYQPWTMVPNAQGNNFVDRAVKGDNIRDNIERIDVFDAPGGTYTITVTHKGSLHDGKQDFSLVVNGLEVDPLSQKEPHFSNDFTIFPNPSKNGEFKIELPEDQLANSYSLEMLNPGGQVMLREDYFSNHINLDASRLSAGIYFLVVRSAKGNYRKKVVIE